MKVQLHVFEKKIGTYIPKSLSICELGLWCLIPWASFLSHTWLPLPPTMLLLFGAVVCLVIHIFTHNTAFGYQKTDAYNTPLQSVFVIFGLFCIYIFSSQYLMNATFRYYMGVVLAPLYLILILFFSRHTTPDFIEKIGRKFIRYSLIILSTEAILRYAYSFWLILTASNKYSGIYQFKFNGPMYISSNIVAGHLILMLFFILWWARTYKQSMKNEIILVCVLIALTFSRASIPAIGIGLLYYMFCYHANWKKSLLILGALGVMGIFTLWWAKYHVGDLSFQSKFTILNEALNYYKSANLKHILFGIGFLETDKIMTFGAHNYFLLFLMESGIFGLLFLLATLLIMIKKTNGMAMVVLLPYMIQTAAESARFIPYFYVIMAFMLLTTPNDTQKNSLLLD